VAYYANALPTELKEISTTAISGGWLWTYYCSYNLMLRSIPVKIC
jgi:hypothetical protein